MHPARLRCNGVKNQNLKSERSGLVSWPQLISPNTELHTPNCSAPRCPTFNLHITAYWYTIACNNKAKSRNRSGATRHAEQAQQSYQQNRSIKIMGRAQRIQQRKARMKLLLGIAVLMLLVGNSPLAALAQSGYPDNPFDRETYRQNNNPFDRETYRQSDNPFDRETYRQSNNPFDKETYRQSDNLFDRDTYRQSDNPFDKKTYRQGPFNYDSRELE